jgi:hypothetical protein
VADISAIIVIKIIAMRSWWKKIIEVSKFGEKGILCISLVL